MDDFCALCELERAIFPTAWSENALREALEHPNYLVLIERDSSGAPIGAPIGYLIGWMVEKEAELARIGVLSELRGQGLGARLLDAALQKWRELGAQRVFLEVRASNAAALRLYQSRGFQIVGKRADYYENGETALVMALSPL